MGVQGYHTPAGGARGGAKPPRISIYSCEVFVPFSSATIELLSSQYPHSADIVRAFAPLLECGEKLAGDLPAPTLPAVDAVQHTQGKAACLADKEHVKFYLDEAVLVTAPELCWAAAQGFPQLKKELQVLEKLLGENKKACAHLAGLVLTDKMHRIPHWAKKHGQHKESSRLVATHLARLAARRVARGLTVTENWEKNYCPVCGRPPQAGFLRMKEGQRFLYCGLCHTEWRFSRTTCPACQDSDPEKRKIYTLEGGTPQSRAEGCDICKRYLLVPDMRDTLDVIPVSLLLYCLISMDMLMQQEGYEPLA